MVTRLSNYNYNSYGDKNTKDENKCTIAQELIKQ